MRRDGGETILRTYRKRNIGEFKVRWVHFRGFTFFPFYGIVEEIVAKASMLMDRRAEEIEGDGWGRACGVVMQGRCQRIGPARQ